MAQEWEPFHLRGSHDVEVNRNDGLVMTFARAVTPLAAATITDALKAMYKSDPVMADKLVNLSLQDYRKE